MVRFKYLFQEELVDWLGQCPLNQTLHKDPLKKMTLFDTGPKNKNGELNNSP